MPQVQLELVDHLVLQDLKVRLVPQALKVLLDRQVQVVIQVQ